MSEKLNELLSRIKTDKRLLIIVVLGLSGILLLTFSELKPNEKEAPAETDKAADTAQYEESLETRLAELISSIDGAGRAKVMITLDSGDENVYATEDKSGEKSYERSYVVIKQSGDENGMLLKIAEPEIRGVAVVCEGAGSAEVRQEIINTVTAVLNVGTNRVNISKMKNSDGG